MTLRIAISRRARVDVTEAIDWYAAQDRSLAGRLQSAIDRRLKTLADFPESCALITATHRRAHVAGFPYAIYYRIDRDRIFVVAVIHHRRGPDTVRDRLVDPS